MYCLHHRFDACGIFFPRPGFHTAANIHSVRPCRADCVGHILRRKAAGEKNPSIAICAARHAPIECFSSSAIAARLKPIEQESGGTLEPRELRRAERFLHAERLDHGKGKLETRNQFRRFIAVKLQIIEPDGARDFKHFFFRLVHEDSNHRDALRQAAHDAARFCGRDIPRAGRIKIEAEEGRSGSYGAARIGPIGNAADFDLYHDCIDPPGDRKSWRLIWVPGLCFLQVRVNSIRWSWRLISALWKHRLHPRTVDWEGGKVPRAERAARPAQIEAMRASSGRVWAVPRSSGPSLGDESTTTILGRGIQMRKRSARRILCAPGDKLES